MINFLFPLTSIYSRYLGAPTRDKNRTFRLESFVKEIIKGYSTTQVENRDGGGNCDYQSNRSACVPVRWSSTTPSGNS